MSTAINWYFAWFWLNCGWFPGEPFKLFCLSIGEALETYTNSKFDQIIFFSIQITYFALAFGWRDTNWSGVDA